MCSTQASTDTVYEKWQPLAHAMPSTIWDDIKLNQPPTHLVATTTYICKGNHIDASSTLKLAFSAKIATVDWRCRCCLVVNSVIFFHSESTWCHQHLCMAEHSRACIRSISSLQFYFNLKIDMVRDIMHVGVCLRACVCLKRESKQTNAYIR